MLLPIGFGAILVNLPLSGAVTQVIDNVTEVEFWMCSLARALPTSCSLLLFIGIGAMIDFGPLLSIRRCCSSVRRLNLESFYTFHGDASGIWADGRHSIAIIGAADGPTSIFVANISTHPYPAIIVAAIPIALVPIVAAHCDPRGDDEEGTPYQDDI